MKEIHYRQGEAYLRGTSLKKIAETFGTPCYVYSRRTLEENFKRYQTALAAGTEACGPHHICYAVKANSNLSLLKILAGLGSGFDIVSLGELKRVLIAGGDPQKIVFSGVGKQSADIEAALAATIFCFNVESESELLRIQELAKKAGKKASIALRINPNIDPKTHPYIATGLKANKFGLELGKLLPLAEKIKTLPNLELIGLACHIGSQLVSLEPFLQVMDCLKENYLALSAQGFSLRYLNLGGGLGVRYRDEQPPTAEAYVAALKACFGSHPVKLIIEPGRSLMADAGLLLSRVEYLKETSDKHFAIMDAAMNDFMRPALYQAWQDIIPVTLHPELPVKTYDLVGPVCESADFLGQNRQLRIEAGDLLALLMAGAYGFCMSSNYNSRLRAAEVLLDGDHYQLIRRRETLEELLAPEQSLA